MSEVEQDKNFIIDGVAHGYDFSPGNQAEGSSYERTANFGRFAYELGHAATESMEPGYMLNLEEFTSRWHPEDLAHVLFVEAGADMAVYHSVEIPAYYRKGVGPSRLDTGLELKKLAPDRVLFYGCLDPFGDAAKAFDQMDEMAENGALGFKFYPSSGFYDVEANSLVKMFYDTPDHAYKFFEHAQKLGIKNLAFHKAQPVGPGPMDVERPEDISTAACAFPDMNFEIVHHGWAFLEESALQSMLHPNIYSNLECVVNMVVRRPRRFAEIIGTLLQLAGPDKLIFATGCALNHPEPIIRKFLQFEMPKDLVEEYGYPELTPEIKRKILGGNKARLHGIDVQEARKKIEGDQWSSARANWMEAQAQGKAQPWSTHRRRLQSPNYPDDWRGIRESGGIAS